MVQALTSLSTDEAIITQKLQPTPQFSSSHWTSAKMRRTLRLLASVKPARYLEAGTPTGLTGLYTHNSPRSSLLYLYSTTLERLKAAPESSLYRQSVEALTKHRMAIVAAAEPPGHKEWSAKASQILKEQPEGLNILSDTAGGRNRIVTQGGETYILRVEPVEKDIREQEWGGELNEGAELEGLRSEEEKKDQESLFTRTPIELSKEVKWEPEPQLTADQYVFGCFSPFH